MNFRVFTTEHLEGKPGNGGSFGCNYFIRDEYPEGTEKLDKWICALCRISDNVDTKICDFYIVNDSNDKVVARGTVEDCKTVTWHKRKTWRDAKSIKKAKGYIQVALLVSSSISFQGVAYKLVDLSNDTIIRVHNEEIITKSTRKQTSPLGIYPKDEHVIDGGESTSGVTSNASLVPEDVSPSAEYNELDEPGVS